MWAILNSGYKNIHISGVFIGAFIGTILFRFAVYCSGEDLWLRDMQAFGNLGTSL